MSQESFDFEGEEPAPHHVNLDDEQHQSLIGLMSNIVIHIFQRQDKQSNEQSQNR